jgi:hypothetical protein
MDRNFEFHVLPMVDSKPKLRRRPVKHQVDRLRGNIAVRLMMTKLCVTTANALARALAPNLNVDSDEMDGFKRTCRRYVTGLVVPNISLLQTMTRHGTDHLVSEVERCLNSVVWKILKGIEVERSIMLDSLYSAPSGIGEILFAPGNGSHFLDQRLREYDGEVAWAVEALKGFEAVETFVLLASYAQSIHSGIFAKAVAFSFFEKRPTLSEDPELLQDFRELFTLIDRQMVVWTSLSSVRTLESHFPWEGHLPEKVITDPNRRLSIVELAELPLDETNDGSQ